jgi:hypothetical protein
MQPLDRDYDSTHAVRWSWTLNRISHLLGTLESQSRMLALGTDGQFERQINATFPEIEIQISDWDLRYEFPTETQSIDLVTAFEVIEHLKDRNGDIEDIASHYFIGLMSFLCESNRSLKKDGHIILTTPNSSSYRSIASSVLGKSNYLYWPHVRELAPLEIDYFLKQSGFEVKVLETFSPYADDISTTRKGRAAIKCARNFEKVLHAIFRTNKSLLNLRGSTLIVIAQKKSEPTDILLSTEWFQLKLESLRK